MHWIGFGIQISLNLLYFGMHTEYRMVLVTEHSSIFTGVNFVNWGCEFTQQADDYSLKIEATVLSDVWGDFFRAKQGSS